MTPVGLQYMTAHFPVFVQAIQLKYVSGLSYFYGPKTSPLSPHLVKYNWYKGWTFSPSKTFHDFNMPIAVSWYLIINAEKRFDIVIYNPSWITEKNDLTLFYIILHE